MAYQVTKTLLPYHPAAAILKLLAIVINEKESFIKLVACS